MAIPRPRSPAARILADRRRPHHARALAAAAGIGDHGAWPMPEPIDALVIGGGPAGLMAAEALAGRRPRA